MLISSEFRMGQYKDDDHHEDAPHFRILNLFWIEKVFKSELHRATSSIIEYLKNEQTSEEVLLSNLDNLRDYMDESLVATGKIFLKFYWPAQ